MAVFQLSSVTVLLQTCLNASLILSFKQELEVKMTINKARCYFPSTRTEM